MGDRLVRKGLVVGIIVLFIGAGVYPAIAVKLNTSTNTIDKVANEDKSISDISSFNLDKLNLLMPFSVKLEFFNSILKSYSKISDNLYKLSSKDCLEIVKKMVKEKLSMTLKTLKIIESKGLIDSLKMKSNYKDIYLRISEISNKYNELFSTFEKTQEPPICDLLVNIIFLLIAVAITIDWVLTFTESFFVYMVCRLMLFGVAMIIILVYIPIEYYDCTVFPYTPGP